MKYVYLVGLLSFIVLVALASSHDIQVNELRTQCEARGGRLVHFQDSHECLDRSIFR